MYKFAIKHCRVLLQDEEAAESAGARVFIANHNKLNEAATKMLKDVLSCRFLLHKRNYFAFKLSESFCVI